jgi:hypothetical protein
MVSTARKWCRDVREIPRGEGVELMVQVKPYLVQKRTRVIITPAGAALEGVELRDVYQWRPIDKGTPATTVASWGKRLRPTPLEKNGRLRLEATEEPIAKGNHYLRTYYQSEGGELLCYDEGPMHSATLDAKRRALGSVRHTHWSTGSDFQKPEKDPKGARLVVLPSQRAREA